MYQFTVRKAGQAGVELKKFSRLSHLADRLGQSFPVFAGQQLG
jgi:hypothetical protein